MYAVASYRPWRYGGVVVQCPCDLEQVAARGDVRYIFFPFWSYKIPPEIYEDHECVIFHMTDVPYGRGGSPLQNLIVRGHTETVVSAIRCTGEIDAGPVYMKRPMSLHGTAEEILLRAERVIADMIVSVLAGNPQPVPQEGIPVRFKRRTPEQGDIAGLSLEQVYDHIRMLDGVGYTPAFIEAGGFRFGFTRASQRDGYIKADVEIRPSL